MFLLVMYLMHLKRGFEKIFNNIRTGELNYADLFHWKVKRFF